MRFEQYSIDTIGTNKGCYVNTLSADLFRSPRRKSPLHHFLYIRFHFYWQQHNVRMILGINTKYFVGKCLAYSQYPIKVKNDMLELLYTSQKPFRLGSRDKFFIFVLR